MLNILS